MCWLGRVFERVELFFFPYPFMRRKSVVNDIYYEASAYTDPALLLSTIEASDTAGTNSSPLENYLKEILLFSYSCIRKLSFTLT
jgi:hypothetical protein